MVKRKTKGTLILSLTFTLFLLGFASACFCGNGQLEEGEQCDLGGSNGFLCWAGYGSSCSYCTSTCELKTITNYCGDGILNSACEECDDGNKIEGDGCDNDCTYSCSNSYGTGIAVGYGNGTWMPEEIVNLKKGNYKIKYFIDNKKESDDNVSITVKLDNIILSKYHQLINSYHSKELDFNTSQLCGNHEISVEIKSDGDECNLSDNYASRQIYVECENPPQQPVCGNGILETNEECDDWNNQSGDGCLGICKIENNRKDSNNNHARSTEFVQDCEPNWQCFGWSECDNEVMTRKCTDINNCAFSYNKPIERISCEQKALVKKSQTNYSPFVAFGITFFLLIILMIFLVRR